MGKDNDLKLPDMEIIEEMTEESKQSVAGEQEVMKNETFNSFIVNADYFGDEQDQDHKTFINQSIDITSIGNKNSRSSNFGNMLNSNNLDATNNCNDTMDDIMANLDRSDKLRRSDKPTKVEDINSVMENQNYVVIRNSRNDEAYEDISMSSYTIKKGTKAWNDWWKKKTSSSQDLLIASEAGNLVKVKELFNKEIQNEFVANITFKGLDDYTALHFAAQDDRYDVCQYLIENGSDVEAKSSIGRTPLHLCSLNGHEKVVGLLVDNGADIN
jgi:ankyrin repeat protein